MIIPIQFVAVFMFLCILLLLGVIYSRIHWLLKAGLVISSLFFSIFAYEAYQNALGYPVPIEPPQKFEFVYGIVIEPNPLIKSPGGIYIWIVDQKTSSIPRAIALPYSKEDRSLVNEARKRVKAGNTVYMNKKGSKQDGTEDKNEGEGQSDRMTSGQRLSPGLQNGSGGSNQLPYKTKNGTIDFENPVDTLPKKIDSNQ